MPGSVGEVYEKTATQEDMSYANAGEYFPKIFVKEGGTLWGKSPEGRTAGRTLLKKPKDSSKGKKILRTVYQGRA